MRLRCDLLAASLLSLFTPSRPGVPDSVPLPYIPVAEYCGQTIDGETFSATAYSSSTDRSYDVDVEFDGEEAVITFSNGHSARLTLDDEEIDDPSSVAATDSRGVSWVLDVDGLECDDDS